MATKARHPAVAKAQAETPSQVRQELEALYKKAVGTGVPPEQLATFIGSFAADKMDSLQGDDIGHDDDSLIRALGLREDA